MVQDLKIGEIKIWKIKIYFVYLHHTKNKNEKTIFISSQKIQQH